ncbi:hypothetical protein P7C73_g2975, partial [Tremellales sp. Uapishka_1]
MLSATCHIILRSDIATSQADPFYGQGSVMVAGDQVMAVNAGSNTFSVFKIDPTDPAKPSFQSTYPSHGEFPVSLAKSADNSMICVLNGGAVNGFSCYKAHATGWKHLASWDRTFGLNLTTPPHGPVGGGPSQMTFSADMTSLLVAVKGRLSTDLNNPTGTLQPGGIYTYAIGENGTLAQDPVKYSAMVPFSIAEDMYTPGVYFTTDVSTGYAAFDLGDTEMMEQGTIPLQAATCWAAQSSLTGSYYTIDIAAANDITEISLDTTTLKLVDFHDSHFPQKRTSLTMNSDDSGTILAALSVGTNSTATDISIFSAGDADYIYVNAPGYHDLHSYKITAPGKFSLIQRFHVSDMPSNLVETDGFAGQAVYYM